MTNLPNEPGSWDRDFSYAYLQSLYGAVLRDFVPARLGDAPALLAKDDDIARVFVRHDLDVSIERGVQLARLERDCGVVTTYHVMLDSPFYDVRSPSSISAVGEIRTLGHEIGLHYDVVARGMREATSGEREDDIAKACSELEAIVGAPVRSLSFHLPVKELIDGPLQVAGRTSGYGAPLVQWYISDSRARWREGEPLRSLDRPRSKNLQILIHPIWWGPRHQHPSERLRDFLHEVGPQLGGAYAELNDRLWEHIIYRAAE